MQRCEHDYYVHWPDARDLNQGRLLIAPVRRGDSIQAPRTPIHRKYRIVNFAKYARLSALVPATPGQGIRRLVGVHRQFFVDMLDPKGCSRTLKLETLISKQ
ncbi:MAG: hypothetical protein ACE5NG_07995, partial [bacterium]